MALRYGRREASPTPSELNCNTVHRIALSLFSRYQRSANILVYTLGAATAQCSSTDILLQPTPYHTQHPTINNNLTQPTHYYNQHPTSNFREQYPTTTNTLPQPIPYTNHHPTTTNILP